MFRLRWWVLAFLGSVVLLGSAGGLLWTRRPKPPPTYTPPAPRVRCPDADAPAPPVVVPAESVPVVVWGGGNVQLRVDGQPAWSPAENPKRLAPGDHTLKATAGADTLELTFRLKLFFPVMLHVEETAGAGLNVVWLGAACAKCPPPEKVALDFTRTSATDEAALDEAAKALRRGDWNAASARLRAVSPKSRSGAAFRRLAARVYQSAGRPELAAAELRKLTSEDLPPLLEVWDVLTNRERAHQTSPSLQRWNLLTQKFATLVESFAPEAPGAVELATGRLTELTAGYLEATQKKDGAAQEETVRAAEEALSQFIRTLRRSRPEDCAFQARITASL